MGLYFHSSLLGNGKRIFFAILLGLLAALAFPPFNVVPVLWISFPGLFFLLRGVSSARMAFVTGWMFAFGLLTVCFHWIAGAMFVDLKSFWWALPFAICGLPLLLSLYYGFAGWAAWKSDLSRPRSLFLFALFWFLAEEARAHLFTGFPWDLLGYVWGDCLPVLQSVSVIGIEGLTFATLLWALLPVAGFLDFSKGQKKALIALGLCSLVLVAGAGQRRLQTTQTEFVPDVRLRLVQTGQEQSLKWSLDQRMENLARIVRLTFATAGEKKITHYIWPETATAYRLTEEPQIRKMIAREMPADSVLITGIVRRTLQSDLDITYYNSLIAMDANANIVAGYDKHHLVPFGEYMPLRSVLNVPAIAGMGKDFRAGPSVVTMRAPHLPPFSPLICYEAIFSGAVAEAEDPPQFLLNVTNDGWYKRTIGPAQHFMITRVRAVEEGVPLVRVANMGITGVVDPVGRIVAQTGQEVPAFVDSDLPKPLKEKTPFSLINMWLARQIKPD